MPMVLLSKIRDNPWRNLVLYPLDESQIDKLVHSINRHGFFGGVRARKVTGGEYELACGHHRIAAARKVGMTSVDIDVRDMSDDEMIRLMVSENAIQAGVKAAAVMNEVGAVTRRFARALLEDGNLAEISARYPLAQQMVADHAKHASLVKRGHHGDRGKMTAEYVRLYVSNVITEAITGQRAIEKEERERLLSEQTAVVFRERREKLMWAVRSVAKSGAELFSFIKQHPVLANDPRLGGCIPQIEEARAMLNALERTIRGKEYKEKGLTKLEDQRNEREEERLHS